MKTKVLAILVVAIALADIGFFLKHRHDQLIEVRERISGTQTASITGVDQLEAPVSIGNGAAIPGDNPVSFHFKEITPRGVGSAWIATYSAEGHTAEFIIEFDPPRTNSKPNDFPLHTGDGHFYAVNGSDPASILSKLAVELQTNNKTAVPAHVSSLPFTYAVLGEHKSKRGAGGFTGSPAGGWTAMKLFVGADTDEDEGEFFLNFNPLTHEAEFAVKDPDYGDIVFRHLATVL